MPSNKTAKKEKKQLVHDYYAIVSPTTKPKRIIISKELIEVNQPFEVFTLYKTNGGTKTTNTTTYLAEPQSKILNA